MNDRQGVGNMKRTTTTKEILLAPKNYASTILRSTELNIHVAQ
jgi:hypothetical protein